MKSILHPTCLLSALLCFFQLCSSNPASASPQVYANAESTVNGSNTAAQSAPSGTVADGNSASDSGANTVGRASASFGVLRAFATTTAVASSSNFNFRGSTSTSGFQDDFLFNAPGLAGTSGTVRVRFTIDGSLAATANGTPTSSQSAFLNNTYAQAEYAVGVGIGFIGNTTKQERLFGDGRQTGTPFLGIEQEAVLDFVFGSVLSDVTLRISALNAVGGQLSNYTSQTTADLEHTAMWGGFAEVRDGSGNLVNNYTFSSASGTDFTKPIPEPTVTSLFLLSGLALSLARQRHRVSLES